MKKIIFCQTPFQIIVSLFIKEQIKNINDQVELVIVDTFNDYQIIAERIQKAKIFEQVHVVCAQELIKTKGLKNIKKFFSIIFLKHTMKKIFGKEISLYDEMYYWNYDAFIASFRSYQEIKGKKIKNFIYDEGYISYMPIDEVIPKKNFLKLIEKINSIRGIKSVKRENTDGILLFEPEFIIKKPSYPVIRLNNTIDKQILKKYLAKIFEAESVIKKYDRKFILFEEAMLANQETVDDFSIFNNIVNFVGKDNVIIKLHPRTKKNRFRDLGVKILGSDGIPWEAVMLLGDFKDKVLITIGSGSITNCRLIFGGNITSYMLFRILNIDLPQFNERYIKFWNDIGNPQYGKGLTIPTDEKIFWESLREQIK